MTKQKTPRYEAIVDKIQNGPRGRPWRAVVYDKRNKLEISTTFRKTKMTATEWAEVEIYDLSREGRPVPACNFSSISAEQKRFWSEHIWQAGRDQNFYLSDLVTDLSKAPAEAFRVMQLVEDLAPRDDDISRDAVEPSAEGRHDLGTAEGEEGVGPSNL